MEESLKLQEQRDLHISKIYDLEQQKVKLNDVKSQLEEKLDKAEIQVNKTLIDAGYCRTELQSQKSLQVSSSAALEVHRLEKAALTKQLAERSSKITELEKEINRLKLALTTRSAPVPSVPAKVTPAQQPPKQSSALNVQDPINEPILDNDAKEELEEPNVNDNNDFDTNL
ncbi:hypothetical protein EVAR_50219_1 [Eumeta japonica]|uniref:Uncharacterized protein n=1 Tax=Eumeta variegata TaxID=151549 RepID=A0A4C1WYQ5_EUMVA|nr:hypothetical protein EVAR_50219_1 [Eumeta japonica]